MCDRIDLEKIRTIADQIRRREKVKKRMILAWRSGWQQRLASIKQTSRKVTYLLLAGAIYPP